MPSSDRWADKAAMFMSNINSESISTLCVSPFEPCTLVKVDVSDPFFERIVENYLVEKKIRYLEAPAVEPVDSVASPTQHTP